MSAPPATLRAGDRVLELGGAPWLMGVVNASPDSFSDPGPRSPEDGVARIRRQLEAGADIIDIGGESAATRTPPVPVELEIDRVVALVAHAAGELGALVSVDTYKPEVADAALAAGASIVNDVSGLRDPRMAEVCAARGAALVLMHTRAAPKQRLQDPDLYEDVTADVVGFLRERMALAVGRGIDPGQLLLDPGPDFAKTPSQTVAVLRRLDALHALGRPLLLAISRKDFVGALTGRAPAERLAGTLAALGYVADAGAHVVRVHDVAAARDFLTVRAALRGGVEVPADLTLSDALRWEREARPGA